MQNIIVDIWGKPTDITDKPVVVIHDTKSVVFCRNLKEAEGFCNMLVSLTRNTDNSINDLYWYSTYNVAFEKLKIADYKLNYSRLKY